MVRKLEQVGVEAVVKGFGLFLVQMGTMNKAIAGTGAAAVTASIGVAAFGTALGVVAIAAGAAIVLALATVAGGFLAVGLASVNVARSVEEAFAGVAKTTNGLTDEFGIMNEAGAAVLAQFRELARDIPLSLEELLRIGELGGQLGIPEEALQGFTRAIAALVVSTDLGAEQASLSLARIQNIYDISASEMVETTERLASSIVFLGNNFADTEPEIVDFAERIAGAGKIVGLTLGDIVGISAAFVSVGVEAQAGGTAVQTVLQEMVKAVAEGSDELEIFARTAGISVDEFVENFEEAGGAAENFGLFVAGLGDAGIDAFNILTELGVGDRRIIRGFLSVAGAGELLNETIRDGNQAFEDNTALIRESTIFYATFNSQLQIAKNRIRDVALEIGGPLRDMLKEMLIEQLFPLIDALSGPFVEAFNKVRDSVIDNLLPALADLLDAFDVDLSQESLITSIQNFGTSVADGIEAIANLTTNVGNLILAFKDEGFSGLLEELGIEENTAQTIEEVAEAVLVFGVNLAILIAIAKGLSIAGLAFGTLAIGIGEVGAAIALFWEGIAGAGLLASIGVAATVGVWIVALALLGTVIFLFGEDAKKNFENLSEQVGIILKALATTFQKWVREVEDDLRKTGPEWADAIKSIVSEMNDVFVAWFLEQLKIFTDWIDEQIDILNNTTPQEAAEAWMRAIGEGFIAGIDFVLGILEGFLQSALAIINAIPKIGPSTPLYDGGSLPPYAPRDGGKTSPSGGGGSKTVYGDTYSPTINASYQNTQSPSSIANDLSLLGKLI